jgi:Ca-activated chloride channel family protein
VRHLLALLEWRQPWLLLVAILAIPTVVWMRRPRGLLRFSALALVPTRPSWRVRTAWAPAALVGLAIVALAIALAGPRTGRHGGRIRREGIAIMMVVDVSGSMRALDLSEGDHERTRLEAVIDVFEDFVSGAEDLPGRPNDAIGLIGFAGYADTRCPLTLEHDVLRQIAGELKIFEDRAEDGTAIGDGLGLAVERLRESKARSRVAILLTDGVNNAGSDTPEAAAALARKLGIKVYAVGAGTNGLAPIRVVDPFTGQTVLRQTQVEIDEDTLRKIADETGGEYFRATDAAGLRKVYQAIDRLERTQLDEQRRTEYDERYGPVLAAGLILAALGWILEATVWRRAP